MSARLKELLERIDAGWHSPPLEPAEDIRRTREILGALSAKGLRSPAMERRLLLLERMVS